MTELLRPYVPRLVIDWLRDTPVDEHRQVRGSLVFADISGFTTLTERLARLGKAGAEEMGDLLNATFGELLVPAYAYGAALLRWGGDAALLLFEGDDHAARACRASVEMQRTIRRIGKLRTTAGIVTLRMHIGVHTGDIDFFLVGGRHRELLVTGPAATVTAQMEHLAQPGEIVVSAATAASIDRGNLGADRPGGFLLVGTPDAAPVPHNTRERKLPDLTVALPAALRAHVSKGVADSEHRLVSTGFLQILGADEILDRDGADVLARALGEVVETAAAAAERHDVTFMASDIAPDGGKIILVAGAPRSHDRAQERLLCALRNILDTDLPLQVRAGASTGRVFAGDFGPTYRRTYSVVGDTVNLAARLMTKAAPGQLIVTTEVVERSRTRFEVDPLEPFLVKGKTVPIKAVCVGAATVAESAMGVDALPFVGRDGEVVALLGALQDTHASNGRLLDIVGDAGMGKSRLLDELRRLADNFVVYSVVCDVYESHTPYATWRKLLRELLGVADSTTDSVERVLRETVQIRCPHLAPWLPLLGTVVGVDIASTPEVEALDERFRRTRLADSLNELLVAIVDVPSLFVLDDVHLMDEPSSELLRSVEGLVPTRPWIFAVARRPTEGTFDPHPQPHVVSLWLTPLDDVATTTWLEAATDENPLPVHELDALKERSGGNPLFLRELLDARRQVGAFEAVPDSLEAVVAAQIDALPMDARRVLLAASVLGSSFDRSLLTTLLDGRAPVSNREWTALSPFLAEAGPSRLRFRHALVREAAYQTLPFRRRVVLHGRAGDELARHPATGSAEWVATQSFHFFNARRYDEAARYARAAGDRARAQYANVEAALFYERAVESAARSAADASELRELNELLGQVRFRLGEFDRAEGAYRSARQHARGDALALANIHLLTAKVRVRAGSYPDALRWLSRGLGEIAGDDSTTAQALAAQLCVWQAYVRHEQGRQRDAIRRALDAIARAESVDAKEVLAGGYHQLDRANIANGCFDYEWAALRALAIWEEIGDLNGQAIVQNHLGIRAYFLGDWPAARACYERARSLFDRIGDTWNAAVVGYNIAEILTDQGCYAEAEVIIRRCLRVFRASSTPAMTASANVLLGRVFVGAGRFTEGRELLESARDDLLRDSVPTDVADAEARVIECLLRAGEFSSALDRVTAALEGLRPDCVEIVPRLQRVRGSALEALGDVDDALRAYEESLVAARARKARNEIALTLDALVGLLTRRGDAVAPEVLDERDALVQRLGLVISSAGAPAVVDLTGKVGVPEQTRPTARR